jgi:hypothetical protein
MDNENNSEENIKGYFEAIQSLHTDGITLNELVSKELEVKGLENEIEQNLSKGNFSLAHELMQDERLDEFTRGTLEHIYENILGSDNVLDELHEKILDSTELEQKVYEIFKEEDFLNDMKKIDMQESMMNEIEDELRQEEIEEHELTLGE